MKKRAGSDYPTTRPMNIRPSLWLLAGVAVVKFVSDCTGWWERDWELLSVCGLMMGMVFCLVFCRKAVNEVDEH